MVNLVFVILDHSCEIWVVPPTGVICVSIWIPLWPVHTTHKINLLMLPRGCANNVTIIGGVPTITRLAYHDECRSWYHHPNYFLAQRLNLGRQSCHHIYFEYPTILTTLPLEVH